MLEMKELVKRYGNFTAVDHLTLTVPDGSIYGFVGPNGAGKTTTMRIMAGLLQATEGSIWMDDVDMTKKPRLLRTKIGYMPDFFGVYDNLKVTEYMDFYAGTYEIPYKDRKDIIDGLLDIVDLSHKKEAYVDSLSRGMKQRLCLARSLIHDPKLLILDEAVSNLDLVLQAGVIRLLKKLQQQFGTACLFITHDLRLVERFCQRVMVMDNGQIVETQVVGDKLTFSSDAGRVLQNAVLPAYPVRRRATEKV